MSRASLLTGALLLAACSGSDDDPPSLATLAISVENELGGRSQITCEPLPLLHGSRRLTEHVIDGAFSITVMSSPNEAELSFKEGARALRHDLVVSRSALEARYDEELTLMLSSGEGYFVSVASRCGP
jgi:hypothetical protein